MELSNRNHYGNTITNVMNQMIERQYTFTNTFSLKFGSGAKKKEIKKFT